MACILRAVLSEGLEGRATAPGQDATDAGKHRWQLDTMSFVSDAFFPDTLLEIAISPFR